MTILIWLAAALMALVILMGIWLAAALMVLAGIVKDMRATRARHRIQAAETAEHVRAGSRRAGRAARIDPRIVP